MPTPKFPELEEKMLTTWEAEKLFEKTLEKTRGGKPFVFFEGPPTANGKPGIHHVISRAFKDAIPRYQTMRGRFVDRKGGWDTHGLPVELQVEKALGISGKPQIENLVVGDVHASIIEFNKKCKESVWTYLDEWIKMTRRMGYWVDIENAYVTYTNDYIESLWSVLKRVHERGLLYQGHKVVPHCPRCGTALSSHEVAQGYKTVTDESVFVKFRMISYADTFFLGWTTTPWTLPGNVALAVGADVDYVKVAVGAEYYILAAALVERVFEGEQNPQIVERMKGSELVGSEYEPLFDFLANEINSAERATAFKVYAADFVTTTDGTGIVHTAVMYGEDDYQLGHKVGLPKLHTVDEAGKFLPFVTKWAGKFVKSETIEKEVIADLQERGLLLRSQKYEHEYPFCWRCSTPLLYYAKDSWFIKMSELSGEMQKRNETIHWVPDHIQDGRFGEWLKNIKDWAISRERYWGTPLPIWKCDSCGEFDVLGSSEEIRAKGMVAPDDLHRPFVDDISYACACGARKTRVKEVADVWFDSGAMFVAQWGYQWGADGEQRAKFESHFPADYISEAIDQTRGWFYTLVAVATLLELEAPFKNVVCISHIFDGKGVKMSKSKGNIIDPWEIFNEFGADPARFFMYATSQPGDPKLFDKKSVDEIVKKVFLIMWNVLEFYKLYTGDVAAERNTNHPLDAWLEARLQKTVNYVTEQLDAYELTNATRELTAFVTDLSTWYVRRSRGRFKNGGDDAAAAAAMLRYTLVTLAKLFAPFTPMIADALHREIEGADRSVHLESWPVTVVVDESVLSNMELVRALVTKALELRAKSGIPIRQVLGKLTVPETARALAPLFEILQEEINVELVAVGAELALDTALTPELREKGMVRELIRHINAARKDAGLKPGQQATIKVSAPDALQQLIQKHAAALKQQTVSVFEFGDLTGGTEVQIGDTKITFEFVVA